MEAVTSLSSSRASSIFPIAVLIGALGVGPFLLWSGFEQPRAAEVPEVIQPRAANLAPAPPAAVQTTVTDLSALRGLEFQLKLLEADARNAGLPHAEQRALADAAAMFHARLAEIEVTSASPGSAGTLQDQITALNQLAAETGSRQAAAVARDTGGQIGKLAQILPSTNTARPAASPPIHDEWRTISAAMRDVKAGLDQTAASAAATSDPAQAIAAARHSIELFSQFKTTHAAARLYAVSAMRDQFFLIDASARQRAAHIIQMGTTDKPGLFASSERRDGWRLRKSNASEVPFQLAKLDRLARSARASQFDKLSLAVDQAKGVQKNLAMLENRSWAAMPRNN